MNKLEDLYEEIEARHTWEPAEDPSEINACQRSHGWNFPDDLIEFHRRYRTVRLFDGPMGPCYRFVPVEEIRPTRMDIYGKDEKELGPDSWLTVCDIQDSNYIALDVASRQGNSANYIDCFHETFAEPGECPIIARSFGELLERALHSGGNLFYAKDGFADYGDGRPLTWENAALRISNPKAPRKGWLVKFSIRAKKQFHHKFFADADFGGEAGSLEAVKRYIEENRNQ